MLEQILRQRGVAELADFDAESRAEVMNGYAQLLFDREYGRPLPPPTALSFEKLPLDRYGKVFCAGKATSRRVIAHSVVCGREFSFPFTAVIPTKPGKYPFFVHNNFTDGSPDKYMPTEELVDNGFAVFSLCYTDVTSDSDDFSDGLAGAVLSGCKTCADRAPDDPGKIAMWAWASMRVMDYCMTLDCLDRENGAIIGHSRLGKTALFTGMSDGRFRYVISSCAGCSGDAITAGKAGEHIADITKNFPYWFCNNYKNYIDESKLDLDQHMLMAQTAPRILMVGSAEDDIWADPDSQMLACRAASKAWENLGLSGFVAPDRLPVPGDNFDDGEICFHLREGLHYLSREDWNIYMASIKKHMKNGR